MFRRIRARRQLTGRKPARLTRGATAVARARSEPRLPARISVPVPPCPYFLGRSNDGPPLLLSGRPQGQRWLYDAVPAASEFQRCGNRPEAQQQQRANVAVAADDTGPLSESGSDAAALSTWHFG